MHAQSAQTSYKEELSRLIYQNKQKLNNNEDTTATYGNNSKRLGEVYKWDLIRNRDWVATCRIFEAVTGLFLSNENTRGSAVDLLALVLREASRDR